MATNDKLYGLTALITVTPSIGVTAVIGLTTNLRRTGCLVYNNSANTVYMAYGMSCSSASFMTLPIATFSTWVMTVPIYLGPLSFIRNAGSGPVMITEILIQSNTYY